MKGVKSQTFRIKSLMRKATYHKLYGSESLYGLGETNRHFKVHQTLLIFAVICLANQASYVLHCKNSFGINSYNLSL